MPVQAPQWTDFLSCLICYNEFECSVRRPISLGCGHTMCRSCLSKLQRKQCPFDQTVINTDINHLPENHALLQLVGGTVPAKPPSVLPLVSKENYEHYLEAKKCVEDLALYLKSPSPDATNGILQSSPLSRPMQRKLVTLINCQLVEEEGRSRGMRAARSLGERSVTELILQHQNPQQLSANLWASVRARGCQFLGPAMQEEVLKLVLLALEDGSSLSRKVLVMFVVQRLAPHFPQASKTCIGHVVQLLYRASCFNVSKCEGDSSLMQLKEEFSTYEALRREHDAQIVQIATEAGLRIAPEQWSSLLYGDTAHKSHMQSIIDKLQTPQSFSQSVQELVIALQRTGDPGNLSVLKPYLELLAGIDPSPDAPPPLWRDLKHALEAARVVVTGLVDYVQNFGNRKLQEDRLNLHAKYKTSMCRDLTHRRNCPRGLNCTFAHSQEELEKFRAKNRHGPGGRSTRSPIPDILPCGEKEDDVPVCNTSSTSHINNYHAVSNNTMTSPEYGASNYVFDSPFGPENSSFKVEITSESSHNHLCNTQVSNLCSLSGSHSDGNLSLNTPCTLNPESPAFLPLAIKAPQVPSIQPSYPTLPMANVACSENYGAPLSGKNIGVIPAITGLPSAKLKLNSKCLSHPSIQNSSCLSSCDTSSKSCDLPTSHVGNSVLRKDFIPPVASKLLLKNQQLECQTLAALQLRRKHLLSQLDKSKILRTPITSNENGAIPSLNMEAPYCVLKTMDDGNVLSYYSPWSSASVFPYGSSTHCTNSDYDSPLSSSSNVGNTSAAKEEIDSDLSKIHFSNTASFWSSEKDEFIPFDPPLVSKYGPISRCSKSLIRGPAPIQVNAVSRIGDLTSATSAVRHPLPSASLAPSFYAASPHFSASDGIIPEPSVEFGAVVMPIDVNCYNCLPNNLGVMGVSPGDIGKGFKGGQLQFLECVQREEMNTQVLKDELQEIEKTIQKKEQNIIKDVVRYIEGPYRPGHDSKMGGTVPTSIGPWPSQTLEDIPSGIPPVDKQAACKD